MRRLKIFAIAILGLLIFIVSASFSGLDDKRSNESDTIITSQIIKEKIKYSQFYPFVNYYRNYIEWKDSSDIYPFFQKLSQTKNRKLKVLHIGDSHLQADVFTGCVRGQMQDVFGSGGRGFVFPYSAAQTHSAYNYRNFSEGEWEYARNVQPYPAFDMGLTGATIYTKDSAGYFKFAFTPGVLRDVNKKVKIYCRKSPNSYSLKFFASSMKDTLVIDCDTIDKKPYIEVLLPSVADTLEFFVFPEDSMQNFFECQGVLLENDEDKGVLYSSVGINGAGYKSILREKLFEEQLQDLNPDLVIIDLGSNDFYPGTINQPDVERDLRRIIKKIKTASPDANILISNTHDLYRRHRNIVGCQYFSELTRKVAFDEGCAFYDYYQVSGGRYSMLHWLSKNLARKDRIHLSTPGYLFKGELFTNALLNSYHLFLTEDSVNQFVVDSLVMDTTLTAIIKKDTVEYYTTDTILAYQEKLKDSEPYEYKGSGDEIYYKIEYGDNLGSIAEKFDVSISDIQLWNNVRGSRIIAGETLIIYSNKKAQAVASSSKKPTETSSYVAKKVGDKNIYEVQSGDNLGAISSKFNVQIKDLMSWNNLKDSRIYVGQKLEIYNGTKTNSSSSIPKGKKQYYTIRNGDNLGSIAQKFEVSVYSLKNWNELKTNSIKAGSKLVVYSDKVVSSSNSAVVDRNKLSGRTMKHTVEQGDTLWDIAKKYNTSVIKIKELNKLEDDNLKIGQILIVKR